MLVKLDLIINLLLIMVISLTASCRGKGAVQVSQFSDPSRTLPARITVVNWNAQKGEDPQFASDLKLLLEREKPDLVFLQEARADLFKPQQMGGYLAESWSYPWPGGETVGVLTLSRVPPHRIKPVPTKYREFDVTAPKVSLVTEYPLANGESLLALNVHLLNFEVWSLKKIRHQLEDLKAIMARHDGPIVMAGDFNTWSQDRLNLVKEITRQVKLKEVTDFPEGRTTGDIGSEFWNEALGIDGDLPLDRVFFSGFKPAAARVLTYSTSDHRPILVQLELRHTESPEDQMVAQAKEDLSRRLSVGVDQIKLLAVRDVTWPDSSLGCPRPEMVYSQVEQKGWLIRLEANGSMYFYHSGEARAPFLCERTSRVIPLPTTGNEFVPPPGSEID